jgi:hypothetical protein
MATRQQVAAVAGCAAATVSVLAELVAPWIASGQRTRTGLSLARTADQLHLVDGTGGRTLLELWFLLPMVVPLAWLAVVLGRPRVGALLAVVAGLLVVGAAVAVARGPLPSRWGLHLAAGSGAVAVCAGLLASLPARRTKDRP